tara:strand:+ start:515 stop:1387 length:873 start_codon:yes stop_codon:yes gene_type:complete
LKKLLFAPFEIKKSLNMMEIQDLITVSNSVAKDPLTSTVYKQYIEERVFNKIVKNDEIWSKNLLKNTNNQILRDFIDKKNFHLLRNIEVGSCVTINTERNNLDELSINCPAVVVKILKGNKNIGYVVPLSFDIQTATHKSLILNENISPYKTSTVLRCEFITPIFLDNLDNQNLYLKKPLITKINNFIRTGKNNFEEVLTGVPNFDPFDIRTPERLYFENYIEEVSLGTRNFLDTGFVEESAEHETSNIINMVDYIYTKSLGNKEISKFNIEKKKLVTDFRELRSLQNVG